MSLLQAATRRGRRCWRALSGTSVDGELARSSRGRAFPAHSRMIEQLVKFGLVGLCNAVIDFGLYNALLHIGPTRDPRTLVLYNTLAVIGGIVNSYLLNSRWTFRQPHGGSQSSRGRQRILFTVQAAINIAVNDAVLALAATAARNTHVLTPTLTNNVLKLMGALVASACAFAFLRLVVFARPDR